MPKLLLSCLALCFSICLVVGETNLITQLEPLRPFIGKTWKGHFANSTPDKPVIDIARWERALNGRGVKITHSINEGSYGGETMISYNPTAKRVEYHYFTTAGFMTKGTMTFNNAQIICREKVTGSSDGITEVKAVMKLLNGQKLHIKSEYLKNGEWGSGCETTYEEAPDAEVKFK